MMINIYIILYRCKVNDTCIHYDSKYYTMYIFVYDHDEFSLYAPL